MYPDSDGAALNWTAVPSGPLFQRVADYSGVPDEDAGYLQSAGTGNQFLVGASIVAPRGQRIGNIPRVGVKARARFFIPAGAFGAIAPLIWSGGQIFKGIAVLITSSYVTYDGSILPGWTTDLDPATGGPWTLESAVAAQVGLEDTENEDHSTRCTFIRKLVQVDFASSPNAVRGDFYG